jgi:2-polyprenyl-6-hydroxyphenyl methylase/3-demethylubiquinone-9 3-methyltransferase
VMNADGSNQRNLTRNPGMEDGWVGPSWSPDGSVILYPSQGETPFWRVDFVRQGFGAAGILLQAAFLAGFVLVALRRGPLPFGALTLLLFAPTALMTVVSDQYRFLAGAFLAGVFADLLVWRLRFGSSRRSDAVIAFAIPAASAGPSTSGSARSSSPGSSASSSTRPCEPPAQHRRRLQPARSKGSVAQYGVNHDPRPVVSRGLRDCRGGVAVPIDNDVYDRLGRSWWDESNPLNVLHGSLTPGRFAYFQRVLTRQFNGQVSGLRALDIGCGGGFLAEEFARLGFDVVGVDPSRVSIETARSHAASSGLSIDYRVGAGEQLPVEDSDFDVVYCCDVLEHVSDLDQVVGETARVLKPGGVYLFDTVNRTLTSKIIAIKVMQEWPPTRIFDASIHDWRMFIKPAELADGLARHGLHVREMVGLGPRANIPTVLLSFIRARNGRITFGELSRRLNVGQVNSTAISYMGFATKADAVAN